PQEIAVGRALTIQIALERYVGVDPQAVVKALFVKLRQQEHGFGRRAESHSKSHHLEARSQEESRGNTSQGMPSARRRRATSSTAASVNCTKQVEAQRPNAHSGGTAGRPVSSV